MRLSGAQPVRAAGARSRRPAPARARPARVPRGRLAPHVHRARPGRGGHGSPDASAVLQSPTSATRRCRWTTWRSGRACRCGRSCAGTRSGRRSACRSSARRRSSARSRCSGASHGSIDESLLRLLTGVAQQAAVAIEQARLHGASLRRAEELAALLRAARTVMGGLDTKTILESIVQEAATIAGTPHVKLMLLDRDRSALRVAALVGSPVPPDFTVAHGTSYSGQVAATGQPLFIADTRDDPDNPLAERDRERGIVTYLGLPVKIRDTVLGRAELQHRRRRTATPPTTSAYLGSFADQAAIALDNARLYEDAQRALERSADDAAHARPGRDAAGARRAGRRGRAPPQQPAHDRGRPHPAPAPHRRGGASGAAARDRRARGQGRRRGRAPPAAVRRDAAHGRAAHGGPDADRAATCWR